MSGKPKDVEYTLQVWILLLERKKKESEDVFCFTTLFYGPVALVAAGACSHIPSNFM